MYILTCFSLVDNLDDPMFSQEFLENQGFSTKT
jgi:hypothetical protein